jgi:hypothetical protein
MRTQLILDEKTNDPVRLRATQRGTGRIRIGEVDLFQIEPCADLAATRNQID